MAACCSSLDRLIEIQGARAHEGLPASSTLLCNKFLVGLTSPIRDSCGLDPPKCDPQPEGVLAWQLPSFIMSSTPIIELKPLHTLNALRTLFPL